MTSRVPNIHQRLTLEAATESLQRQRYVSTLLELTDDKVTVALPTEKGQWVLLEPGLTVDVVYSSSDGMHRMRCKVLSRHMESPARLVLHRPEKIHRVQRRDFVRLDVSIPFIYRRKTGEHKKLKLMPSHTKAKVRDLSGGGALIAITEQLQADELIDIEFVLQDLTVKTAARVVRVQEVELDDQKELRAGLEFIDLSESVRDKIIRFLFAEEARRRRESRG